MYAGNGDLPTMWSYRSVLEGNAGKHHYEDRMTTQFSYAMQLRSADEGSTIFYTVRLFHFVIHIETFFISPPPS